MHRKFSEGKITQTPKRTSVHLPIGTRTSKKEHKMRPVLKRGLPRRLLQ